MKAIHSWAAPAALAVLLFLTACGQKGNTPQAAATRKPTAVPVTVAVAETRDVPLTLSAIGTVEAFNRVEIRSQITGQLMSVHFTEGQDVRRGDLLFTIDRRPLEADLQRAEAQLAKDVATAANDRAQAERYAALLKEGVVSKQLADQMRTTAEASQSVVAADKAAVEHARVQLRYTTINSPLDGRTGDLVVERGNIAKANDQTLVTINQVNPIHVTFTVPEQFLPELKRYSARGKLKVDAQIGEDPNRVSGKLDFIDNKVDRATGTIKLKASFDNKDRRLWPGQFVNVTATLATEQDVTTVPIQAVQSGQQGQFVFVINNEMLAESRNVRVRRTSENVAVIEQGVQPGENVVTDGQLRLTPNAKVEIRKGGEQAAAQGPTQ